MDHFTGLCYDRGELMKDHTADGEGCRVLGRRRRAGENIHDIEK